MLLTSSTSRGGLPKGLPSGLASRLCHMTPQVADTFQPPEALMREPTDPNLIHDFGAGRLERDLSILHSCLNTR